LESDYELHRYLFDSTARSTPLLPGEPSALKAAGETPALQAGDMAPRGLTTDLAAMLEKLGTEGGGGSGAGAIIISDGRHNAAKDVVPAALALQRAGVPLYCIGVGQEATPAAYKDVRIRELVVPEKAFVGSHMVLRVEIGSTLPAPVTVPLTVEVAGKRIFESNISLPQGANVAAPAVEVPYVPEALGVHRVVAALGTVDGEADVSNNTRSAFFRVYRSKLGVWYVEGAIRKEFGAIRSALETAPNVQLKALNAFMVKTSTKEELLPGKPEDREQLRLAIIGDLPASRFDRAALQDLAKFVERGGAVLMLGGSSSFGAGGWQHSPLAPVLPVEMTANDGVHNGALRITVVPDEAAHPVLAIGDAPAQSAELWQSLPPLPGINRVANTRPAAHVLLRAGMDELLVVQEYGKGRSAVFTGDTTWQWALKANQGETQRRFWRNLAVWLTRSDYRDTEKVVFADAERLQYQAGEEVLLRAYAHETEKTGAVLKQASITIALTRFQGEAEVPVLKEEIGMGPGEYEKRVMPSLPGSYRFRVNAVAFGGRVIGTDSVDIQVTAPDVEHDNPKANLGLLRRIASLSGGMYCDPEHAAEAFQALLRRQAGYSRTVTDVRELWNQPWLLGVFIGLLTLEWALRKRWGLI
ncbi:MAG: glutamine amidotransferase, partial [Planctomycetota bacterium]|nr:glutamine amidotransferase [Planctomycetota bacterium]